MNVQMISENKVEVILTAAELTRFNLTFRELSYENPDAKRAISSILIKAGQMTGFSPRPGRLLIEVFPTRDAGCRIFFTRLIPKVKKYRLIPGPRYRVYAFDDLADLVKAARLLSVGALLKSEVFFYQDTRGFGGRFALITAGIKPGDAAVLSEFGERSAKSRDWLREHAKSLASGADIQKIGEFYL